MANIVYGALSDPNTAEQLASHPKKIGWDGNGVPYHVSGTKHVEDYNETGQSGTIVTYVPMQSGDVIQPIPVFIPD